MIEYLKSIDTGIFMFLNGLHSPLMDQIMYKSTKAEMWIPFYLIFLFLVIKKYRWQTILIVVALTLLLTVSDQLCNFFKESVQRLRPSHQPGLKVHLVNLYKGGMYGFYSGHASNFFALAMFLAIMLRRFYRWFVYPVMIWAAYLSYTRIYLGVHYPGDILTGMIMGLSLGYFFGRITYQLCIITRGWFFSMK